MTPPFALGCSNGTNAFHVLSSECLVNTLLGHYKSSFGVMSLRDNVAFLTFLSVYFILLAIVHTKITYGITILFHHYYYGITMPLHQPYDWFITNLLHLAVGCKHTGYKSLMAGLGTEWIYDAFAGKSSIHCITFFFTRLYELTNHCVDTLACIFRF